MQHLQRMCSFCWDGKKIRNDFVNHQLDLQGFFRALNVCPRKHMVPRDQVKGACNVTPVWVPG